MLDALLYAVRDVIRNSSLKYNEATCEIMRNGKPPSKAGNVFVAIHEGPTRSTNDNCLMEYFSYRVTLSMKITVPADRIGDQMEARNLVRSQARASGFNARAEELRALLHMGSVQWQVLTIANQYIADWTTTGSTPDGNVYGFCEPARYRGMESPVDVIGDWFAANPEATLLGLKSELRFDDARRMQPLFNFV